MSTSSYPSILSPPASFHPPAISSSQSPSSQSSGRKRKRNVSVTALTRFTEATRNQLLSLYSSECWFCNVNTRLDNCHVIGQKDRGVCANRACQNSRADFWVPSSSYIGKPVSSPSNPLPISKMLCYSVPSATANSTIYNAWISSSFLRTYSSSQTLSDKTSRDGVGNFLYQR